MCESPRDRGGELEYGPNDTTTETALPCVPHYWVSISSFVFIDIRLAEVHSVFWAIRRRSRDGVHLRRVLALDVALRAYERIAVPTPQQRGRYRWPRQA